MKYLPLLLTLLFTSLSAQNFSAKQLIKAWRISDKTQTLKAEETYKDLKFNRNPNNLNRILTELNAYLKKHRNERLEIRIKMYEILSELELTDKLSKSNTLKIQNLFKKAIKINDPQLLSELYTIFSEHHSGKMEDNLFYTTQAIKIQEEIGVEYFPKLYQRYFTASVAYYKFEDYQQSIEFGNKCFKLFKNHQKDPLIFCLQSDILGLSHYQKNQIDSGFYHYNNIKNFLDGLKSSSIDYKKINGVTNEDFISIWNGVSNGGIARGLILQKKYDESLPLLFSNLASSEKYNQRGDIAKTKNLLGEVYFEKNEFQKALKNWKESAIIAHQEKNNLIEINALEGIIKTYKFQKKFDSAFFYSEKFHLAREHFLGLISHSKLIETRNRVAFQEMENSVQKAENKIRKQQFTRNLIIGSSVFIFIIGLFSYNRFRLKQNIKFTQSENSRMLAELEANEMKNQIDEAKTKLEKFKEKLKKNKQIIESLKNNESQNDVSGLREKTILTQDDWEEFKTQFNKVYPDYMFRLRENFPEFTPSEIRYLCLVKLSLQPDEISSALGISTSSLRVTWHRMRKKLKLPAQSTPKIFLKKFEKYG